MLGEPRNQRGVTLRAVLIGLAFVPINVYLVVQWETVWDIQDPTTLTIAFNAVFCLFLVILVNLPIRRYLPNAALHQGELLTIYSILMVAVPVSGHDFTHSIMGTLGNAHWFATPENEWANLFLGYVPEWLSHRCMSWTVILQGSRHSTHLGISKAGYNRCCGGRCS